MWQIPHLTTGHPTISWSPSYRTTERKSRAIDDISYIHVESQYSCLSSNLMIFFSMFILENLKQCIHIKYKTVSYFIMTNIHDWHIIKWSKGKYVTSIHLTSMYLESQLEMWGKPLLIHTNNTCIQQEWVVSVFDNSDRFWSCLESIFDRWSLLKSQSLHLQTGRWTTWIQVIYYKEEKF